MDALAEARRLLVYMTGIRRQIHSNPEVGFEERETSALIAAELTAMGLAPRLTDPTGVVADIVGAKPGKTVLLRADIDALPIEEKTGLDYASRNAGVSHACGHDVHAAMLLGAAKLLIERRNELHGTVRLLFQPAEETGKGSLKIIEQGVLDGVNGCFAEHIFAQQPVGCVITGAGQVMAGAGTFKITVSGASAHGAMPEAGADALLAGAEIVTAIQSIVSRDTSPTTPLAITVGTFHAGSRYNVVAGEAVLEGTVRALDRKLLASVGDNLARVASGVAAAHRCTAETEYARTCESLVTDADLTELARKAALAVTGDARLVVNLPPTMGSEDFAEFSALSPCAFAVIGGGGEYPQHSDRYWIDESAMATGAALHLRFALDFLAD